MMRLEPRAKKKKMEVGNYLHEMLRAFYLGEDPMKASEEYWKKMTADLFEEEEQLFTDIRKLSEAVLERYIEHYAKDDFQVLAAEDSAYAIIPTATGRPSKVRTQAKIDLVVEDRFGIWFWDHKCTEDFKGREEDLPVDNQFNMYYWTCVNMFREQGMTLPIAGACLNLINPRLPSVPELLKNGKQLSKDKRIFTDEKTYLQAVLQHGFDPADYDEVLQNLRDNPRAFFDRIRVTRPPEQLQRFEDDLRETAVDMLNRRNIYRNCDFTCKRMCPFYQACVIDMKGGDANELLYNQFSVRKDQKTEEPEEEEETTQS
jgi:hypothetical protein